MSSSIRPQSLPTSLTWCTSEQNRVARAPDNETLKLPRARRITTHDRFLVPRAAAAPAAPRGRATLAVTAGAALAA
jgi:hypothetical protein